MAAKASLLNTLIKKFFRFPVFFFNQAIQILSSNTIAKILCEYKSNYFAEEMKIIRTLFDYN